MVQPYAGLKIDKVAGLEARGFILGGAVAHQLSVGFIPVRKKGKLPHTVIGEDYDLEYGKDRIEIHIDALEKGERVLLVDDLIATGGTAFAGIKLLEREIDEYYANFRVSNDLIELRNLVQTAHLIVSCAQRRRESRGLHFSRDYPELLPRARDTRLKPPKR